MAQLQSSAGLNERSFSVNYDELNKQTLKELKPSRLASCYQTIGLYHATLMSELEVHEGVNNSLTIEHYLSPHIRD